MNKTPIVVGVLCVAIALAVGAVIIENALRYPFAPLGEFVIADKKVEDYKLMGLIPVGKMYLFGFNNSDYEYLGYIEVGKYDFFDYRIGDVFPNNYSIVR